MIHLGFSEFFRLPISNAGSILTVSGGRGRSNSLNGLANSPRPKPRRVSTGDLSLDASPISSRQSQKAAALLLDLGIVDIR
jgi:hypothetical protein